jgi:methyl coenzyme M reductase subunit C-like uncharacterized protein (methanogenesis marker protein 7)
MINSQPSNEEPSIQENLYQLSIQLGQPLERETIEELCQDARNLLSHIDSAPMTLARVAGGAIGLSRPKL